MRILVFLLMMQMILPAASLQAQLDWQHRTDSVTKLIQQYYNTRDIPALYALAGVKFKQTISEEKFRETTQSLYLQIGHFNSYTRVSSKDRVAEYKAVFDIPMVLLISLDDSSKLDAYYLRPGEADTAPEKARLLSSNPNTTALDERVDSAVKLFFLKPNTVGMVLGVLKDNSTHVYGYGETERGNGKIPNGNTLFEIGSISKTFTATLLADLVVKKKISLDAPVNKYLPDSIPSLQYNGIPVTIRSLSNHSSGLPRLPLNLYAVYEPGNPYKHYDNARLYSFLTRFKPTREPGKQYEYSNLAVGLLGVVLERVSGKPYEQLLQQNICKPLGMKNTRLSLLAADSSTFATGHNVQGKPTSSWEFKSLAAAGGIRSSVNDMLLFAKSLVNDENSPLSKAMTLTRQQTFEYGRSKVALGWHIFVVNGKRYYSHNGQTGGYFSSMVFDPQNNTAIVILTNSSVDPGTIPFSLISSLDQN